jgi:murein DD-endopeptidase MepM/ murein hydrolase activator NlpD
MALNLARVQEAVDARRRGSQNRDYTLPSRRETRAADLEVNAPISRPNNSGSQVLLRTLGLAEDFGQSVVGYAGRVKERRDKERAAQAAVDFQSGTKDEKLATKYQAYRESWYTEKAKASAAELDRLAAANVVELLADEDDPATLEDVSGVLNAAYSAALTGADGKLVEFETEEGRRAVADQMARTRARIMGEAVGIIRERQLRQHSELVSSNLINELQARFSAPPLTTLPGATTSGLEEAFDASFGKPAPAAGEAPTLPSAAQPAAAAFVTPFRGGRFRVTDAFGAPRLGGRKHNGLDMAVPAGTVVHPILPGGTVLEVDPVGKTEAGKFVKIDHGNGYVSSYSHLGRVNVVKGEAITGDTELGPAGSTGRSTGPHVHLVVRKNGKAVDPQKLFGKPAELPAGGPSGPAEQPTPPAEAGTGRPLEQLDVEDQLARFPDGVQKKEAKASLIQAYLTVAGELRRPDLLDSLWRSKKKDGSNSFSPEEINSIREARDRMATVVRIEAERAKDERYENNLESLFDQWNDGKVPTTETLVQWGREDRLPGKTVRALIEGIEADDRREEAEARAEARADRAEQREADREVEAELEADTLLIAENLRLGNLDGHNSASLRKLYENGSLGQGKAALRRWKTLNLALRQGGELIADKPEAKYWAAALAANHKPKAGSGVAASMRGGGDRAQAEAAWAAMSQMYQDLVKSGTRPPSAYLEAVAAHGNATNPQDAAKARATLIERLKAKAAE